MAINVINSQGTKVHVTAAGVDLSDCSAVTTALASALLIGCPQSIGALEETREVTEYKCLSSDETAKALGGISRGSIEFGLLLDPEDAAGQDALRTAFADNTAVGIIVELPDGATTGTTYSFEGMVSAVSTGIEQDAAITYTATVEIASAIIECPKT